MREKIGKFFGENTVFQASIMISFFIFVARILGVIRDRIFAVKFGASAELDSFFAAFRLPDLMFSLVIIGAFASAFIPVFMELKLKGKEKLGFKLISKLTNLVIVLWVVSSLIILIFAPYFVKLVAPGFSGVEFDRTVFLTRILLLSPLFLGLSNIASSTLNSYKRFFLTALAPSFYNIGIILGALFLTPRYGITGLALGVILGAFLHFLTQWLGLKSLNFKYSFDFNFFTPKVKEIVKLAVPRVFTNSIYQLNLWVQTAAASFMIGGSISALNFAQNIQGLPVGLVGVALSSAIFPTLTEIALLGNHKEMRQKIIKALKIILLVIIPMSLFLIILRAQAVRLILGAGHFDWYDTQITASVVGYLSISLFAQCFVFLLNQSFFAYKDTRTPLKAALIAFFLNIFFILLFSNRSDFSLHLGIKGIALAFSLASMAEAGILMLCLRHKIGGFIKGIMRYGFLIAVFALASGLIVQASKTYLGTVLDLQYTIYVLLQGLIPFILGTVAFVSLIYIFKIPELSEFKKITKKVF
ncbi:MAG: murein biosynthesis integral membrane protein MurJ [Patescibacteria group bacterium]|nr:murein biosynthesis integral membrane protein MurJ [Patescibacteria group bacterium]